MAGPDLRFDGRDLPAAASDSCGCSDPFLPNVVERPPVAVELGFLAAQRLPALDDDIDVLRVEFQSQADALGEFRGGACGAAAKEWLGPQFPTPRGVPESGRARARRP